MAHPLEKTNAPDSTHAAKPKEEHVDSKQIPLYEHDRPHKLDGTIAMATLLRRIYEKTHVDSHLVGEARESKVIFAADDATELVKELVLVTSLDKPHWGEVQNELSHALRGIMHLESEAHGPEKARLSKAVLELQHVVDPKTFAAAKNASTANADKLPAMDEKERLEMAAQAIIAACRQAALFSKMKQGDDLLQAQQLMGQMRLHYDVASDAISNITDKRLYRRLDKDVALATAGMDNAVKFITAGKRLPWDLSFAQGFDAEQRFLKTMGLKDLMKDRPFTGTINPKTAIEDIDKITAGKGDDHKYSEDKFQSPQEAVAGIGVVMNEIFSKQDRAVKNATSDIGEPRVPKESSMLDTLLEILIKTALAGAAGAIGSKISSAVSGKLNKALSSKAVSSSMFGANPKAGGGDYFQSKDAIEKDALGSGAAATTMRAEGAKDAFKEFFKSSGYKAIMSILGGKNIKSNSTNPLHVFSQHSEDVLGKAQLQGKLAFVHLAPALGQAEPGELWDLYQTLLGHLDDAYTIQYSHAMEEWQNFKARAYSGIADDWSAKDKHAYHEGDLQSKEDKAAGKPAPKDERIASSDAKVGDGHDEKGALLIEAWINTDDFVGATGMPHVTSVRLPDAEDATLKHFHEGDKPLADVHMNKHFKFKFIAYMNEFKVDVGVGADHGLLGSTMDKRDQAALRVVAAGDKLNSVNWMAAVKGEDEKYARFSVRDLEKQLEKFIKVIQKSHRMSQLKR